MARGRQATGVRAQGTGSSEPCESRHRPCGRRGRSRTCRRIGEGGRTPLGLVALDREAPPGERLVQGGGGDHGAARVDPRSAAARGPVTRRSRTSSDRTVVRQAPLAGCASRMAFSLPRSPADPGLSLLTYSAEPGSPSEEALRELARWSETRTKWSAARAGPEA